MYFFISLFIIKILKNDSVGSVIQNKRGRETKKEAGKKSNLLLDWMEKNFCRSSWSLEETFYRSQLSFCRSLIGDRPLFRALYIVKEANYYTYRFGG